MDSILLNNIKGIENLCKTYNVKTLYAFGSVLTDKFSDKSDIDFLVSFNNDIHLFDYADNYFDLKDKLSQLFGREIDLITDSTVSNPYFKQEIEKTKKYIYG